MPVDAGGRVVIDRAPTEKYSGRVGRSAMAKEFDASAIGLAVGAYIRHTETPYDELLNRGIERQHARALVREKASAVERSWRGGS